MKKSIYRAALAGFLALSLALLPVAGVNFAQAAKTSDKPLNFYVGIPDQQETKSYISIQSRGTSPIQVRHNSKSGLAFLEAVAKREHGLTLQAILNRVAANPRVSGYMNSTFYNAVNSALSKEYLNRSLQFIKQANSYRPGAPLRVSAEQMMIAAVSNGIHQASHQPHILFYSDQQLYGDSCEANYVYFAENLAEGYADPFEGWYTHEGNLYAQGDRSESVGHYTTLMNGQYNITGFATAYDSVPNLVAPYSHCQVFGNAASLGNYMTVEAFQAALNR